MAAIDHEELLEQAFGKAERVVDFTIPDSGALIVLPVTHIVGLIQYLPPENHGRLLLPIR